MLADEVLVALLEKFEEQLEVARHLPVVADCARLDEVGYNARLELREVHRLYVVEVVAEDRNKPLGDGILELLSQGLAQVCHAKTQHLDLLIEGRLAILRKLEAAHDVDRRVSRLDEAVSLCEKFEALLHFYAVFQHFNYLVLVYQDASPVSHPESDRELLRRVSLHVFFDHLGQLSGHFPLGVLLIVRLLHADIRILLQVLVVLHSGDVHSDVDGVFGGPFAAHRNHRNKILQSRYLLLNHIIFLRQLLLLHSLLISFSFAKLLQNLRLQVQAQALNAGLRQSLLG